MDDSTDMKTEIGDKFDLFGWSPHGKLSDDENFMDLVMLVTRSSQLKQGSMACIIAKEVESTTGAFFDRVICAETNQSLYKENSSDIHAEVAAIGCAAKNGRATDGAVAYITMPPCRRCFAALASAGIRRIVTRHESNLKEIAAKNNIEMVRISPTEEQSSRLNALVREFQEEHGLPVKKPKTESNT